MWCRGWGLLLFQLWWDLEALPKIKALQGDTLNVHTQRGRSFPAPAAGHTLPATVGERQSKAGDSPVLSQLLSQACDKTYDEWEGNQGGEVPCQRLHSRPWIQLEESPALLTPIPSP